MPQFLQYQYAYPNMQTLTPYYYELIDMYGEYPAANQMINFNYEINMTDG